MFIEPSFRRKPESSPSNNACAARQPYGAVRYAGMPGRSKDLIDIEELRKIQLQ